MSRWSQPSAGRIYLFISAAQSFLWALAFTLGLVYQVQVAHLNPFQLVFVGTVLEATTFVMEMPTGLVADLVSRRLSVIIGFTLIGAGVLVVGCLPAFVPILIGNIVWGVGYTFISGATESWITDEVGAQDVHAHLTRAQQAALGGTLAGTVTAGVLGAVSLQWPTILAGMLFIALALILVLVMPEAGFTPAPREERSTGAHLLRTVREGLDAVRTGGVIRSFLVVALLTGICSEVFDRLWVDRVLDTFALPSLFGFSGEAMWFTLFALISTALSLVASTVANRYARDALAQEHPRRAMALLMGLNVVGVAGFALVPWLWGALAFRWMQESAAVVAAPVRQAWLNRNIAASSRATTLSLMSQADAIGQVAGGPAFGALAARTSVSLALVLSAIVQVPGILIVLRLVPARDDESEHGSARAEGSPPPA